MNSFKDTLFLLNPKAKHDTGAKNWKNLHKKYPQLPEHPLDITKIDLAKIINQRDHRLIVIAGGDGAINAVSDIVSRMKKKPMLSIVPLGTGNAISYCFGV